MNCGYLLVVQKLGECCADYLIYRLNYAMPPLCSPATFFHLRRLLIGRYSLGPQELISVLKSKRVKGIKLAKSADYIDKLGVIPQIRIPRKEGSKVILLLKSPEIFINARIPDGIGIRIVPTAILSRK